MAKFGEVVVVYDILPEVAAKMEEVLSEIVRKVAFDLQAMAQVAAPVDTGFLKNSIYVVTNDKSTYDAASAPSKTSQELLPEVERPSTSTEAVVAVGANYGVYVEYGTVHQPAHPYLGPAAELMRGEFLRALTELEGKLAESVVVPGGGEG